MAVKSVKEFILKMLQKVKMAIKKNTEDKVGHSLHYYDFDRNKDIPREIKYFNL